MYLCRLKRRLLSVVAAVFASVPLLFAQVDMEGAKEALREAGYANIRVAQNDSLVVISIQNDAYKLQASGIAAAIRLLGEKGVLEAKDVRMIVTDYDVPRVSLKYDSVLGDWNVSHRLDRQAWDMVRREKKENSSFGKVDITVYPQISLMNLIITQVYQSLWQLSPAVEVSLWPGSKLSYQIKIPVFNDGYGAREGKVHPGMITLSQRFRIPGDIYGRASVGVFSNNRWGAAVELEYRMPFNPRFWVEGYFSMLGLCYFEGFTFHMDPKMKPFFGVGAGYYWPLAQTSFTARVRKNLLEDYSLRLDMIRHFRYVSIGFYVEKGLNSYAKTNGGFKFAVSLPPQRYKRYKYVPRVTTSGHLGMSYNANNEQRWYKEVRFEASDNILGDNAFNPYYIKKEIDKLNK